MNLPSLHPLPDKIGELIYQLLHQPTRPPELGAWLLELLKSSGHLSMNDDMRWRLLGMVWLAAEYDLDAAWPYLMWFNQGEPTISSHLSELLYEAVNEYLAHVHMAQWMTKNERLQTLFKGYQNSPSQAALPKLLLRLLKRPKSPDVGLWLGGYCELLVSDNSQYLRRWRLFTATWYATCFDSTVGLKYLQQVSPTMPMSDLKLLTDTADELNATPLLIQWIADCANPNVKAMLQEFGHPNLEMFLELTFQKPPAYDHLKHAAQHAPADAQLFRQYNQLLQQAQIPPQAVILDLACGPLATQSLLLTSSGYSKVLGVDLHIPPNYWPLGFLQRLMRGKYVKAWEQATENYYQALSRETGVTLNWKKVELKLADVTRLDLPANQFEAVICSQYLPHAPNVMGLLAEAARLLKPNGLFLADIHPYASLTGDFLPPNSQSPWLHLRSQEMIAPPNVILNQWREAQYRQAIEQHFQIEQWLTENDTIAESYLTPEIQHELANYSPAELTRRQIMVVARKKGLGRG